MGPGSHDEFRRALGVETGDLGEIVHRLLGEVLARHDAAARELERELLVHAFEAQQILGRLRLIDDFLADERLRDQYVAGARAQLLDDLRRELLDACELARRNVRDLLERREAFLNEDVGHVLVDVELLHEVLDERACFLVALLLGRGFRHDVELPAGQLAREANVLPASADGLRQLLLVDGEIHRVRVLVDDDRQHFGGRHRVDDELRGVLVVENDVDALAGELVRNGLHARAAHADACADGVDAGVVAADRDLGAQPRIARGAEDLDEPLADLRHLDLEQLDQEFRRRARQEQLRAARLGANLVQQALDAVLRLDWLARDQVLARNEALGVAAEIDVRAVTIDALDDAADELACAILVRIDDLLAFGLAHFLHDDLLRGLRRDAAELHGLHRLLDESTDLGFRIDVERVLEPQLARRFLDLARVVGEHFPAPKRLVAAVRAVDRNAHVDVVAVTFPRGGRERRLDGFENHRLLDALLVRDRVHYQQNFFTHLFTDPASRRQPRHRNLSKGQTCQLAIHFEQHLAAFHAYEPTRESPSTVARTLELDLRVLAAEPREVLELAQPPIETGRRHLEHVTPRQRILHIEQRADLLANSLAIVDRHAAVAVDEQPQQAAPPEMRIEIHELETHRRDSRL